METPISLQQYVQQCAAPADPESHASIAGHPYLLVQLHDTPPPGAPGHLPHCPVIGLGSYQQAGDWVDLVAESDTQLQMLVRNINAQPVASTTLVQVLRHNAENNVTNGLLAESLAYSSLQHSSGFRHWLQARKPGSEAAKEAGARPVLIHRDDGTLEVTLNRPHVHNAFSDAMKTGLCEALLLAHADPTIKRFELNGRGPSFCAGGDLTEFGQAADAGTAHLSRLARHAGQLLADLPAHSHVRVHGACIGAGIEVPAFADEISAAPDAQFRLPEVAFGLIPGAGGTVSIVKRIGRQRTAYMALSNASISAAQALRWGLVDHILEAPQ